jgi:hypothetical protein
MPKVAFTDLSVRSLKPGMYFDTKTPAFGLRVGAHRRTWIVLKGVHSTKLKLGHYPALPLADARKQALIALGSPYAPKETSITFETAVPLFLEENYRGKKERTMSEAKRLLAKFSALQKKTLTDTTDDDLKRQFDTLARVPSEQLHAFRAHRTFLRWCTRPPHRYIKHSPLEGYAPPGEDRKGDRVLTDRELAKVWFACEGQFGAMIRLLILWGTRNGETARTKRIWVEEDLLTIPGKFTKNGRSHSIPLLPMARAILDEQPEEGDYFFVGNIGPHSHFNDGSWGKLKKELDKRSGVTGWQVRDLRRTFRSNMAKLRVSREVCEILLNHVTGGGKTELDEIYDRYDYLPEKREALAKWEQRLGVILAPVGATERYAQLAAA